MRKWTIHHLYNQYLHTLWLALLLLTSCNTGEIAPATLQANPGTTTINTLQANPAMPAIDTLQASTGMVTSDTAYFTELLFEGILEDDLSKIVLSRMCGAPIEEPNKDGNTPLIEAIIYQSPEAVHYLIQQGADINRKNQEGCTPLHHAVRNPGVKLDRDDIFDSKMPHILCSHQADVNIQDNEGNTSLHYAVLEYEDKDFKEAPKEHIQILLKAGAQLLPNNNGDTPLTLAKSMDRSDIVALLEKVEKEGTIQSTIPSLGTLCKETLVSYLLSPSDEVKKKEKLYDLFGINFLGENNIHIDTNFAGGDKLIHLATKARNLSMIQFLLQYDPSQINYTNLIGQTPLHTAAENGELQVVECLLQHRNNLNTRSESSYSPLHYATIYGHDYVIACLVGAQADINIRDKDGRTCLHYAAYNSSLPVAWYLINNDANINVRDIYGGTPLYDAVRNGPLEVIDYLINNGAHINLKDTFGKTPLDIAIEKQFRGLSINKSKLYNIVTYLRGRGALLGDQFNYTEEMEDIEDDDSDKDDEDMADQDTNVEDDDSDEDIEDDDSDEE
jgi:ankyrin repeat protein